MQLPDGSRLAAIRDVVPHPTVTIRRHHLVDVTLDDLAATGMLSRGMAGFLRGIVRARRSISSPVCPRRGRRRWSAHWPERSRRRSASRRSRRSSSSGFTAWPPSRPRGWRWNPPGSTEIDPATGRRSGEITLADLLHQTLRMSVTRVIIGEVRGAEALPMLEAMNAGMPGSMCTLHAARPGTRWNAW